MAALATIRALHSRNGWLALGIAYGTLAAIVPLLTLALPRSSALHLSDYTVSLAGKILCYAMVAVAVDLIWGYAGILSVYFSIIPQALPFAFMLLFFRNATGFGGNNGFTDFKRILGFPLASPRTRVALFVLSATALLLTLLVCRLIVRSKLGRILTAIRDAEGRLRFCGYDPVPFKLFVWTLSAVICGIAGALYVPQVGIINPSEMSPANSIEIAIWTAVGGRGTLLGPVLGAAAVNLGKSWFTKAFPEYWLFALGLLFILVTRWLPDGMLGLLRRRESK